MFAENLTYLLEKGIYQFSISQDRLNEIAGGATFSSSEVTEITEKSGVPVHKLFYEDLRKIETLPVSDIKFLVLDIDGVMTDGGMYYSETGDEHKKFNTKDGMSLKELKKKDFKVGIISSGYNKNIIQNRADLFGIQHVHVGTQPKMDTLTKWCEELNIALHNVAFIGDDINDKPVLKSVGLSACPSDAVDEIKEISQVILSKPGGGGCVREFVDRFLMPVL